MLKTNFSTVDEFFSAQEEPALSSLKRVRKAIHKIIPDAEEYISYQIPTIKYRNKPLIGYAAFKKHYSVFVMSNLIAATFLKEYPELKVKGSTVHFDFDEEVPLPFLKKLIGTRMMETDEYYETKGKKDKK